MNEGQRTVSDRNHRVFLLENLKTFLRRLFSDLLNIAKIHTWDVRVQNQVQIPDTVTISNQIDSRPELTAIEEAVKNIPEVDLSPVVEAVNNIPKTEIPEFPTAVEITNQPDMEIVSKAIVEAIKNIPENKVDLSKLEKLMSDKTMSVKEMKEVTSLLKMMVDKMNEPEEEKPECKLLSEKIEYYSDGSFMRSTCTYTDKIVIENRSLDDIYTYEEIDA